MVRSVSDSACPVVEEVVEEVVVVRLVQHVCKCRLQPLQTLASQHINSACAIKFVEECYCNNDKYMWICWQGYFQNYCWATGEEEYEYEHEEGGEKEPFALVAIFVGSDREIDIRLD